MQIFKGEKVYRLPDKARDREHAKRIAQRQLLYDQEPLSNPSEHVVFDLLIEGDKI